MIEAHHLCRYFSFITPHVPVKGFIRPDFFFDELPLLADIIKLPQITLRQF
jgi:hypothetical protein